MGIYRIEALDEATFAGMREEWDALVSRSAGANIFLTWEWLFAWWRHFRSPDRVLRVICARDVSGCLRGILPLYQESGTDSGSGGTLRFLGTGPACSEYLDLIVETEHATDVASQIFSYLVEKWNTCSLKLTDFPKGSGNLNCLERVLREAKVRFFTTDGEICPFLKLSQTPDGFLGVLKPKMRSNYRRHVKKFHERFGTTPKRVETQDRLRSAYDTLFALHGARLDAKGKRSSFLSEGMRAFHFDVGNAFLDRGWLRLYVLEAEDRVVGTLYCFAYGDKLSYYQTGFDPEFETWSVGQMMVGAAVAEAVAGGMKEFDFLRGTEPYKWHWTDTYRSTTHLTAYPRTLAGALQYRCDRLTRATSRSVRAVLGKRDDPAPTERRRLVEVAGEEP